MSLSWDAAILSVSYPFRSAELVASPRWLDRWWPSRRLGVDPQQHVLVDGRYAPVSIANWKLIPSVAARLLANRVSRPLEFHTNRRLTVIIPYRDRAAHLEQLLPVLRATLQAQRIEHRVLVVEQANDQPFNRGRLLNIGVQHAADSSDYFCLHDVDAIPINANYLCPSQPLRLVNWIHTEQGRCRRENHYFSGAVSIRKDQIYAANGFSNEYWGWGKEDDDFFFRLLLAGFLCYFDLTGEFRDLPNPAAKVTRKSIWETRRRIQLNRRRRSRLVRGLDDPALDGLSNAQYEIVSSSGGSCEKIAVTW